MRILLDLEDRPFLLKQLSKLYHELPTDLRSRKSLLPASELILEATEYISYLKSTKVITKETCPFTSEAEQIPKEITEKFAGNYPFFYDGLKKLKTIEELKVLANLMKDPLVSPLKLPCYPLELNTVPRAHIIVYKAFRDQDAEVLVRSCNTTQCINPHHYNEHTTYVFLRTLGRRIANKRDTEGSKVFLHVLLKKLNPREIKIMTKGFSGDRKDCFPVCAKSFPSRGEICVRQLKEYVQHLLYKTFRFHHVEGELCLLSSDRCSLSRGKYRETLLCFNPWHFEFFSFDAENRNKYRYSKSKEHICEPRLVVTLSFSKYMCRLCWTEVSDPCVTSSFNDENDFENDIQFLNSEDRNPELTNYSSIPQASVQSSPVASNITDSQVVESISFSPVPLDPPIVNVIPEASEKKYIELKVPAVVAEYPLSETSEATKTFSQSNTQSISDKSSETSLVIQKSNKTTKTASPVLREKSTRKRKIQAIFQCWKCLFKFTTNSELENHPCSGSLRYDEDDEIEETAKEDNFQVKIEQLDHDYGVSPPLKKKSKEDGNVLGNEVSIKEEVIDEEDYEKCMFDEKVEKSSAAVSEKSSECISSLEPEVLASTIYTCQFCGFCNSDISALSVHTDKCKSLGLRPLPGLSQEKAVSSASGGGSSCSEQCTESLSHPSCLDGKDCICPYCGITFADLQELRLHAMKVKCRSIQCGVCSKFYATTRTHQHHECDGLKFKESDGIIYFKINNLNSSSWLVDCGECGLTVPSRHVLLQHQSARVNSCDKCKTNFSSVCKFISHPCLKDDFGEEFNLKVLSSLKTGNNPSKKFIKVTDLNQTIKCGVCGKMFINLTALEAHRSKAHI